jgi:glycosyltransferase involved in cell wall biosynthesis
LTATLDAAAAIWVDLTDMVDYLAVNVTLSGIQRVVANLLRAARSHDVYKDVVRVVIPDFIGRTLLTVDIDLVIELVDAVEIHQADRAHLDRLLQRVRSGLRLVVPAARDVFLMPGAFWISHNYDLLKDLRGKGVHVSLFIHDLIQINNPDYVERAATDAFRRSLIDVLEVASFVTTNSEFVAREVRRFLRDDLELECPVEAVPLATEMGIVAPDPLDGAMLAEEFGERGYALCVCTIEIRKNHQYLVDIWEQLISRGRTDVPTLVLVGKWGWEIEPFRRHLHATDNLNGMVRVMSGVSDKLLASLYQNALFTLYPSFAEGWGLPVGESLVFGKPCIASGVTSIPEVGGSLVRYFDPLDLESGLHQVTRLLDDRVDLERWTEEVRTQFRQRTWRDFSFKLIETTLAFAVSRPVDGSNVFARLRPGEMAIIGNDAVTVAAGHHRSMRTGRMARGEGWHHIEFDGVWMKARRATLCFIALGAQPGEIVQITLELAGTNKLMHCAVRTSEGLSPYVPLLTVDPHGITQRARVGENGEVGITIIVRGEPTHFAHRDNYLRLIRFGFRREGNLQDKIKLMESRIIE